MLRRTWKAFDAAFAAMDEAFAEMDATFADLDKRTSTTAPGTEETVREEETRPDGTRIVRTKTIRRSP